MSILRRLFGLDDRAERTPEASRPKPQDVREANRALADDPIRFAEWISSAIAQAIEADKDLSLCPSEEQCQRLQITRQQREACRREFSIMRALGACMFVGKNLPPAYYKTFKAEICAATAALLYGVPIENRIKEISSVIDEYLEDLQSDSSTPFSLTYLERVYSGNPNQAGMFAVGLFQLPLQQAMGTFEVVREAYCQLKWGLPSEALKAIVKVMDDKGE